MKSAWRLFVSALLVMALCLPLAKGQTQQDHFDFDPLSGTITAYKGPGGQVAVPGEIGGFSVRRIGDNAFNGNREITSVILPQGLSRIGHSAFYFCENLNAIQLPDSLEAISPYALFACAALEALELPAGLTYIGDLALSACYGLKTLTFTGQAPLLGPDAFINGPEDRRVVAPIEDVAAYEALLGLPCEPGAPRVAVDQSIPEEDFLFEEATGTLTGYLGEAALVTVPAAIGGVPVRALGEKAFFGDKGILRLALPEGLEAVGDQAFYASALVEVLLPDSLKTIGKEAFAASRLMALSLPPGLEAMGPSAFASNQLTSLALPEGLRELPEGAFARNRNLPEAQFPASLERLGTGAFAECSELDYLIFSGRSLPQMGEGLFEGSPIADVDIAWNADKAQVAAARDALAETGLDVSAFYVWRANRADEPAYPFDAAFVFDGATAAITSYQGELSEMTMFWSYYADDGQLLSVQALGEGLFEGSSLRRFFVPHSDALTTIGPRAFAHSQLEEIYLFDSVTTIGAAAFKGCEALGRIEIPASAQYIGPSAFEGCAGLSEVIFLGGSPVIEADAFKDCPALGSLTLPASARLTGDLGLAPGIIRIADEATDDQVAAMAQALALPWPFELRRAGEAEALVPMPDEANAEADFEFDAATGTLSKYIGSTAEVVVPRAIGGVPVERIGMLAFSDATVSGFLTGTAANTGLTRVVLPETVRIIEDSAFLESRGLKSFICYGPVERLGIRAFENCVALESVSFVNGIREVGLYAFHLTEALREANLGDKVESIGEGAFSGAGLAGTLTLSASQIGDRAFLNCKNISVIHVTHQVESIGLGAFQGLDNLEALYFDRAEVDILGYGRFQFTEDMDGFKLYLPKEATDEALAAFVSALNQNLLPGEDMVLRGDFQ